MKIIIQQKKVDKHTGKLIDEEVSLDNDDYDRNVYIRLVIGDRAMVDLPVADLLTAVEAFYRHERRDDEAQIRAVTLEKGSLR